MVLYGLPSDVVHIDEGRYKGQKGNAVHIKRQVLLE